MLLISELLDALFSQGILISDQSIRHYRTGYTEPIKGHKKYFSFYPDVLPVEGKNIRGWYLFDYDKVLAWLEKHKAREYIHPKVLEQRALKEKLLKEKK